MAPESERAQNESNRTQFESGCSEVVERLPMSAKEFIANMPLMLTQPICDDEVYQLMEAYGRAILHSWRERRVQELEKALRWSTESLRGCLPLIQGNGYRDSSDKIKDGLTVCDNALGQIRKGANHG